MKKLIRDFFFTFYILAFCSLSFARQPIQYTVSFPNAVHHEAEITVRFADIPKQTLELRMSRSSPGRYAIHEFAKNVYNVTVLNGKNSHLAITRPNPYQWNVSGHDGVVTVRYTLFADRAGGTYSGIDATHAHLNIPATFMWARGLSDRPVSVTFQPPNGSNWKVATQLAPTDDPVTFTAPNLYYFMDSPTELSDFTLREWQVQSGEKTYTIRLALHHNGTDAEAGAYAEMAKRVVYEQEGIFGELPAFDFGTYTFLADYLSYIAGDGMEHRNSTIIASTRPLKTGATRNLGTLAHEFFHAWNVERIRPKSLEPFNFERANMSGELWFAEGFTSYYTALTLRRAGLSSLDRFAQSLSRAVNFVVNAPGRKFFSAVEMSMQAPFVDAATSVDPTNRANTYISYYTYGMAIGLGLDLTLRTQFPGKSLDDLMREMWRKHGKTEIPYTNEDIRQALAAVTGDEQFAKRFFDRIIFGREVVDYEKLLADAGFLLRKKNPGKATLGDAFIRDENSEAVISGSTLIGTPLYNAGLDRSDRILEIAGKKISSREDFDSAVSEHKTGDTVSIRFKQRGSVLERQTTFIENPELQIVPFEHVSRPLTEQIIQFREQWLGSKAFTKLPPLAKY
jgi:predicted metalloprotease with PDZ domain